MKSITFYSYKGGVGRSLALSNIAIRLSELKKKVCVLDFDLEAPGLNFKFKNYHKPKLFEKGIVDYIYDFAEDGIKPKTIREFSYTMAAANGIFTPIDFIPAGNIDSSEYWQKLSRINWTDLLYREEGFGVRFFLDLKEKIKKEINPDFLLIDSRTGITDIAGISLRLMADEVVILAANNEENIFGSKKIIKSLTTPDNSLLGEIPKINFVLTRLPFTDKPLDRNKEAILKNKIEQDFKKLFPNVAIPVSLIHADRRLEENEQHLIGIEYEERTVSIENDYLRLFDAVCIEHLSANEIKEFQCKRKAEKIYQKAKAEKNDHLRIDILSEAIALDKNELEYYTLRGVTYYNIGSHELALEDFQSALKLNKHIAISHNNVAAALMNLNRNNEAKEYIEEALAIDPSLSIAHRNNAVLFEKEENYEDSLNAFNYVLQLTPNDNIALNSRANLLIKLKRYKDAYIDIYKAIELNSDEPIFYGTLAELSLCDKKEEEFYFNLAIAFSKGLTAKNMSTVKEIYLKVKNENRFLELLEKYGIDVEEIFAED
jgi:tetratricopeptide (TPR) repeat protein